MLEKLDSQMTSWNLEGAVTMNVNTLTSPGVAHNLMPNIRINYILLSKSHLMR